MATICYLCDSIRNTRRVYKFAFLLVILHPPGLIVVLKWTKKQQTGASNQAIPLPAIPKDPLCPVAAFKAMLLVSPTMSPNDSLLLLPGVSRNIVTVGKLKTVFRALIKLMGHQPSAYSLHSLRRTGATLAYEAGVDYLGIKRHGTWRSGAFWEYITTRSTKNSKVASGLANIVKGKRS